jgi:hypothetical protein
MNNPPLLVGGSAGKLEFPENATPANITASSGALTISAGGTNQNVTLTPSGTGKVSAGAFTDVAGRIRAAGNTGPSTGAGMEMFYTGTAGGIVSFDRGSSAFKQFTLDGDPIVINATSGGNVGIGGGASFKLDVSGDVNTSGVFRVGGTQVVGPRGAAVAAPSGGTAPDSQARTAINALIARLQAHGLIS